MHTLAAQSIEVNGQCGSEGFTLACAHLGDLALVQSDTTHHLHIKVAHLHDPLRAFPDDGKSFRQQSV